MSININSFSGISSRKGVSGLMSGLDTDSLVKQLTSTTRSKITRQLQNKQVLAWKQSAYQGVSKELSAFYNKYFQFSSSSSSIMNNGFFNASSVTSSSTNVSVSGNNSNIENVVIKDIQQMADKAGFTSNHTVSKQELSSGIIYNNWNNNTVAGNTISISYGGKEQNITISGKFHLDSHASDSENVSKVVNELNAQIDKNAALKGNLKFGVDATGAIKLSEVGANKSGDLKIVGGSNNLLSSLGLYKTADGSTGSSEITGAYKLEAKTLFESNRFASSSIKLNLGDTTNNAYLYLEDDFRFSAKALEKDAAGQFTVGAKALQKNELQDAYNTAIQKNPSLKDKISLSINDKLEMTITAIGDNTKVKVIGGDKKLLEGLGLSVAADGADGTATVKGQIDVAKAFSAETKQLGEVLSGTNLTFNLNGVSKNIVFKESEKAQFSTVADLKNYVQKSLDNSFGKGRISVTENGGKLGFTTADPSHTIAVNGSSASGILGETGALHMVNGESNRAELVKTLDQVKDSFATPLVADADGKYKMSVNGKNFEFSGDTLLGDVISKINSDSEAGVTISYSSVTDHFSVVADETGSQGKVDMANVGTGNLATALFGSKDNVNDGYTAKAGSDFKAVISFDGGKTFSTVNRSANSFEMDGTTFDVKGMSEGTVEENVTFKLNNDTDKLVDKITKFVDEYNKIVELVQGKVTEKRYGVDYDSKDKYLPLTDEEKETMSEKEIENWEKKAQTGILANDSTLNSMLTKMRRAMSDVVGDTGALHQIGITTGSWRSGGTLIIDETKLRESLAEDPNKVTQLFTGDNGIATRLQSVLKETVAGDVNGPGLLIALAGKPQTGGQDSSVLSGKISSINNTVATLKDRLKTEETRWYGKFTQLESLIAKMNSQSEYFSSLSA
ncbi:MAG: flagellar filament capping protein FliD [Oscillospiraceae bacterium]